MSESAQQTSSDNAPYGRTATGSARTSAYYALIGPPPHCAPGDHALALEYVHKIEHALARGGWTPYEQNRLRQLYTKWSRRAFGKDPRFNAVGTRTGRLTSQLEHELRPKQRRASPSTAKRYKDRMEARMAGPIQSQRSNPERRWRRVEADLPSGQAKGAGASVDPDVDAFEPEAGDMQLPTIPPARQYLVPGQDGKGHAHRIYCRVMPAHYRALCVVERSKQFGFRTVGDVVRWCVDYGVRELLLRKNIPQALSALAQVDVIREILLDEQYYMEFPQVFEQMQTVINKHLSAGAIGEAVRVIAIVRAEIEKMAEPYWREKYLAELMAQYGTYLDGSRGAGAEFGGEQ